MKIAIVFPKDSEALFNRNSKRTFGGANVQMYMIAKELSSYGTIETISYINPYDEIDFDESDKFKFIKTFKETDNILKKIIMFHFRIKKTKPDIIVQRGLTLFSCLLALYCRLRGIRFVFMFAHDIEAEGKYQGTRKKCYLFPMLLRYSFLLIVQNVIEMDLLRSRTKEGNLKILKKGLEIRRLKRSPSKVYDAVWVARCEEWKNPELFIRLAALNPGKKFIMICSEVPGKEEYFREIKEAAKQSTNLTFLNFVKNDEIYNLLLQSRIFVITSDQEGDWPMVVLEALSCGVPVLSLKLNYNGLLTEHGAGCYCYNNFEEMNKEFGALLKDKKSYTAKSAKALDYVKSNHEIKNNVRELLRLIEDEE